MMRLDPNLGVFRATMGYWRVRIRTHEWLERQRVSLLDLDGVGKSRLRMLYSHNLSTADLIITTPTQEIVSRCFGHTGLPNDVEEATRMVEDWKTQIRHVWSTRTSQPMPESWTPRVEEPDLRQAVRDADASDD